MDHLCKSYYELRECNSTHYFVRPGSVPYFNKELNELKQNLKKMRKNKYKPKRRHLFNNVKYNKLRNKYRNLLNQQKEEYLLKTKRDVLNSKDPKNLMLNIKRLTQTKKTIPLIINSTTGNIPNCIDDSMHNLNQDLIQVGVSDRSDQYDSQFINNKKKQINQILNNMKIGCDEWKQQINSLDITENEILKIFVKI